MTASSAALKTPTSLVSVVVPCYNYGHFLPECVLSVISQTYSNWELLIVDDGSSDNTHAVALQLQTIYAHLPIYVVSRDNGGLNAARNTGINHSSGRYILTLDADDLIAPTFLEKTVALLNSDLTLGFVYTDVRLFGNANDIWHIGSFNLEDMKRRNYIVCHTLFRREAWISCGGYNEAMRLGYDDWDFWLSLAEQDWRWQGVPEPLALYRKHGMSMIDMAVSRSILLRAQIILNHPALYGADLVRLANEIMAVEQIPILEITPASEYARLFRRHNAPQRSFGNSLRRLAKKHALQLLAALPLYHQMLLRKWWYLAMHHLSGI